MTDSVKFVTVPSTEAMDMSMNTWYTRYRNRPEFLAWFDTEQAYVDAMFILIVYANFGILLDAEDLL